MSVFFNGNRDGHYDRGGEEILKYDRVHPNAGEGLNPTTGIFTCPVGGTYMFIIHLSTHKDKVSTDMSVGLGVCDTRRNFLFIKYKHKI